MNAKAIVKSIVGEYTAARVKRLKGRLLSGKKTVNAYYPLSVTEADFHTTFGYYDHSPVCGNKLLFLSYDKAQKNVRTHVRDLNTGNDIRVISSNLANWQQGNRLYWLRKDRFIFNDFTDGKYVCREFCGEEERVHPYPVYDANETMAVSVDFSRLGYLRAGYGYTDLPFPSVKPDSAAMSVYDFMTDELRYQITYGEIMDQITDQVDLNMCYINHVSISPDGNRILFFFIEKRSTYHMCYLGVYEQNSIRILDQELSASHYAWSKDSKSILTTSYDHDRKCGYYLYSLPEGTRKRVLEDLLKDDGHPTLINDHLIITDTYPDSAGFQHLKLVDLETGVIDPLVDIYSSAKHMGVQRCDLHPRYDAEHQSAYFDADTDGHRRFYRVDLENQKWIQKTEKKSL